MTKDRALNCAYLAHVVLDVFDVESSEAHNPVERVENQTPGLKHQLMQNVAPAMGDGPDTCSRELATTNCNVASTTHTLMHEQRR